MEAGLSLGSNQGNRLANLQAARDAITHISCTTLIAQSPVYETEPVGVRPEYKDLHYLNAVILLKTEHSPQSLSSQCHALESRMGRIREEDRYAPRIIDIDILYMDALVIASNDLILPHPEWYRRRFVTQPLADLRPDLILPGTSFPVGRILETLPEPPDRVRLLTQDW